MGLTNIVRDVRGHVAALLAHGATGAKTPNTTMARDASGRSKVADPAATDDVATKGYTDTKVATETTARTNAVSTLNSSISSLSAKVTAETNARVAADNGLQTQINNLSGSSGSSAPKPQTAAGVGQWVGISTREGDGYFTLPAGGVWAYFAFAETGHSGNPIPPSVRVGVANGGSNISSGANYAGFAWRIS